MTSELFKWDSGQQDTSGKLVTNGDAHDHSGGDGAQIDHGGLAGLADDDHTQYVKADGSRAVNGDLRVAGGVVVGNGGANDPGNGEIWLQEQSAMPGAAASVMKLINHGGSLRVAGLSGWGEQFIAPYEGWTLIPWGFTRHPTHTNLITNPSFEVDAAGWNASGVGSSITRQTGGLWGSYCGRVVMAGSSGHSAYITPALTAGITYRVGFYARSISGSLSLNCTISGTPFSSGLNATLTSNWQWFSFTDVCPSFSSTIYWQLAAAGTFEIDGVHVIQTTLDPPYSDPTFGSGHKWDGTAHASTSQRLIPVITTSGYWGPLFGLGTKIMLDDGGTFKYFYIVGSWYDTYRNLTVIMPFAGTDYVLNSSPNSVRVTNVDRPSHFPHWFNWQPEFTGFSANPTGIHRFAIHGRTCMVNIFQNPGTSNSGYFIMSLPVNATTPFIQAARVTDNGAIQLDAGMANQWGYNSRQVDIFKTLPGGVFTASGNKGVQTTFNYEWN